MLESVTRPSNMREVPMMTSHFSCKPFHIVKVTDGGNTTLYFLYMCFFLIFDNRHSKWSKTFHTVQLKFQLVFLVCIWKATVIYECTQAHIWKLQGWNITLAPNFV
jgi:hypothetical protein